MLAAITLLWSCDNTSHSTFYTIQVKNNSISCSYDPQTIEIEYTLMGEPTMVSATTSADWVQSIDTSTDGKIVLDVAANDDAERSTTLTISAAGHVNAKIKLTQIAPPKDTAHTLMFYFFGTSLSRYFKTNINDAKTAIKSGALGNNNRVIYILQTGSSTARIREICYAKSSNECIERELETVRLDAKLISPDDIAANIAYAALTILSVPMMCVAFPAVSMFLWACLLIVSVVYWKKQKKTWQTEKQSCKRPSPASAN